MASLSEIFIKEDVLETLLKTVRAKKEKGVKITVSLFDKSNEYGQNVTAYVSQTKEQVANKANKFYVGNGNTYWTKGETPVAIKKPKESNNSSASNEDFDPNSLPF